MTAHLEDGFLRVVLPKKKPVRRTVEIERASDGEEGR